MTVPTTHLGETAVALNTKLNGERTVGVIVAVGLDPGDTERETEFYYLLELPDGCNLTMRADYFGIVRHGNQFACTECKGRGEVDLDAHTGHRPPHGAPTRWVTCPACKGSKAIQPGQTWGPDAEAKPVEPAWSVLAAWANLDAALSRLGHSAETYEAGYPGQHAWVQVGKMTEPGVCGVCGEAKEPGDETKCPGRPHEPTSSPASP